jgi:hypothetical protein
MRAAAFRKRPKARVIDSLRVYRFDVGAANKRAGRGELQPGSFDIKTGGAKQ